MFMKSLPILGHKDILFYVLPSTSFIIPFSCDIIERETLKGKKLLGDIAEISREKFD